MPEPTGGVPDVPWADGPAGPARSSQTSQAAEAARTLRELDEIGARSLRVARAGFSRVPLTLWGTGWVVGYAALDLLPWTVAVPLGLGLAVLATGGTWWARSREVVSDGTRPVGISWVVLMACSPLLVLTITPAPVRAMLLLLGALWGVALLMLAVASGDRALGVVGAVAVLAAALANVLVGRHGPLVFGLVGGIAMAGLGLARIRVPR